MATATTSPGAGTLLDRQVDVETPEHVAVSYELAGLGSRFAALFIDMIILQSVLLLLWVGVPLLALWLGPPPGVLVAVGAAALVLLGFACVWGYFIYFEGLRDGQTPGKKRMRLRTVHDGGYPLTLRGAAVRALLHLVDMQPIGSWMVGGLVMTLHPRTKRLGDLAAGSMVVRERTEAMLPEAAAAESDAAGPPRLDDDAFHVLRRYMGRRGELETEVRSRIARRLADRLREHVSWDPTHESADAYVVRVYGEELARRGRAGVGAEGGSARATALFRRRRATWDEYRSLLDRARRRGLGRLPDAEVSRFAALYRQVAADLARARTYGASPALVYTLGRLVGAGHNLLYRPSRRSWTRLKRWFTHGFPALIRRRRRPIALAAAVFFGPAVLIAVLAAGDPELARELLPAEMIARAERGAELEAAGRGYVEVPEIFMPLTASSIIANNVQVTFVAFAGGVLAGLGTLAILLLNGVFLGAVAGLFASHGLNLHLWSFVLPHGVIELTAITIAGGAGLWLGSALVLPGRSTRGDALVARGREAISLIAGTAMLLVMAGLIEGFISPARIPRTAKLGIAAVFAMLLVLYLLRAGRGSETAVDHEAEAGGGSPAPP